MLRAHATDPRWRTREAVAMALQRWGRADMDGLVKAMRDWAGGQPLERRAAAAALCEPDLLREERYVADVLDLLDQITASLSAERDRRGKAYKTLRKGMGYCWSVAVAASPALGLPRMERWLSHDDRDVRWVMKQNLRRKRLARAAPEWTAAALSRL